MSAKFVLILLLLFLFSGVNAQGKRKQKKASATGGTEIFFVNKDDGLRDGPYTLVSPSGNTRVSGYYVAGQKDSVWTYYLPNREIRSQQYYRKGSKTGIWEFYTKGALSWTYDIDSDKAHFIQPEDTVMSAHNNPAFQDQQGNWVHFPPEKHALQIISDYLYVLLTNLRYPEESVANNQQGQVAVAILVDQQGNPETYEVGVSSGYPALDAEALRVMKLTHQEFIPATNKGIKVKSIVLQQVNFKLETQ